MASEQGLDFLFSGFSEPFGVSTALEKPLGQQALARLFGGVAR